MGATVKRRFGFECELASGAVDALNILADKGLARDRRLHSYHCHCEQCDYNSRWAIRGQQDCTADGELITKILTYDSDEANNTIAELANALQVARAGTGTGVGFHVHVGREDMDQPARLRLYRMFLRYQTDLDELASTSFSRVRDYNTPLSLGRWHNDDNHMGMPDHPVWANDETEASDHVAGGWLVQKRNTFEFRLWNSTRAEWRMHLAVGVSVAMVNAAVAGVSVNLDTKTPLEFVLGDFLDDKAWSGIIRQRYSKGGIAA